MKKAYSFFLILVFSVQFIHAQKELHVDENIAVERIYYGEDRDGKDEEIFYVLDDRIVTRQTKGGSEIIQVYNGAMEKVSEKEVTHKSMVPQPMEIANVVTTGNSCYGIGYQEFSSEKKDEVYLLKWNEKEFKFGPEFTTISTIVGPGYFQNMANAYISITESHDGSKILVSHKLPEDGNIISFRLMVFDREMSLESSTDIRFDIEGDVYVPLAGGWQGSGSKPGKWFSTWDSIFNIDSNGDVYTWTTKKRESDIVHLWKVIDGKVSYDLIAEKDKNWELKGFLLMHANNKNGIWMKAHYSDAEKEEDGIAIFPVTPGGLGNMTKIPFDDRVCGEYMGLDPRKMEKTLSKGKHISPTYANTVFLEILDDGGYLVVLESLYLSTLFINDKPHDYWYGGGIMVLTTDGDGSYKNAIGIRRNQIVGLPLYIGSYFFMQDNKLMMIFNDHPDNLKSTWTGYPISPFNGINGQVAIITLDVETLAYEKRVKAWSGKSNSSISLDPTRELIKLNDNKYLGWSSQKNKRCLISYSLK